MSRNLGKSQNVRKGVECGSLVWLGSKINYTLWHGVKKPGPHDQSLKNPSFSLAPYKILVKEAL